MIDRPPLMEYRVSVPRGFDKETGMRRLLLLIALAAVVISAVGCGGG